MLIVVCAETPKFDLDVYIANYSGAYQTTPLTARALEANVAS